MCVVRGKDGKKSWHRFLTCRDRILPGDKSLWGLRLQPNNRSHLSTQSPTVLRNWAQPTHGSPSNPFDDEMRCDDVITYHEDEPTTVILDEFDELDS